MAWAFYKVLVREASVGMLFLFLTVAVESQPLALQAGIYWKEHAHEALKVRFDGNGTVIASHHGKDAQSTVLLEPSVFRVRVQQEHGRSAAWKQMTFRVVEPGILRSSDGAKWKKKTVEKVEKAPVLPRPHLRCHLPELRVDRSITKDGSGVYRVSNGTAGIRSSCVMRGRVTGPYVVDLSGPMQERDGNASLAFGFFIPGAGSFQAQIEVLYEDYRALNDSLPLFNNSIFFERFAVGNVDTAPVASLPYCNLLNMTDDLSPYWTLPLKEKELSPFYSIGSNAKTAAELQNATLSFRECQLRRTLGAPGQSGANETLCFFGDSQSRHMANAVSRILHNIKPDVAISNKTDKEVEWWDESLHSQVLFFWDPYAEGAMKTGMYDSRCTYVVANFGQHPLVIGSPWSVDRYKERVLQVLSAAKATRDSRSFLWLTVHPAGLNAWEFSSKTYNISANSYRTSFNLGLYAAESRALARRLGVNSLNLWEMGNPLLDLSYDASHYKLPVEYELATVVLASIDEMRRQF